MSWEADLGGQQHLASCALWLPGGLEPWRALKMGEGIPPNSLPVGVQGTQLLLG